MFVCSLWGILFSYKLNCDDKLYLCVDGVFIEINVVSLTEGFELSCQKKEMMIINITVDRNYHKVLEKVGLNPTENKSYPDKSYLWAFVGVFYCDTLPGFKWLVSLWLCNHDFCPLPEPC